MTIKGFSNKHKTVHKPILVFDGVCHLCNRWVMFVLRHDPSGRVKLMPFQSAAGERMARQYHLSEKERRVPESVLLIKDGQLYDNSDAIIQLADELEGPIRLLGWIRYVPRLFRDRLYKLVAQNRYKWFGRKQACMIPEKNDSDRFIIE